MGGWETVTEAKNETMKHDTIACLGSIRECDLCGLPIRRNNKSGVCSRPACTNEQHRRNACRNYRGSCWAELSPDQREKARQSARRSYARHREKRLAWQRAYQERKVGPENPNPCKVCGGRLNRGNRTGICMRNPECIRAHYRKTLAGNRQKRLLFKQAAPPLTYAGNMV